MKAIPLIILSACVAGAVVATLPAQSSPVGKWTGRVNLEESKLPKSLDTGHRQQLMAQATATIFTLDLRKDSSYLATSNNDAAHDRSDSGSWRQAGDTVILTSSRQEASGKQDPQRLTFGRDGKTLTLHIGPAGDVIFKRSD
jgi:hypothetical protein